MLVKVEVDVSCCIFVAKYVFEANIFYVYYLKVALCCTLTLSGREHLIPIVFSSIYLDQLYRERC